MAFPAQPLHRCAVGADRTVGGTTAGAASTASNTITFAEGPGAFPNYIFPYMSCTYFSVDNTQAFQYEMFRPVYWFGLGKTTVVQPKLSRPPSRS